MIYIKAIKTIHIYINLSFMLQLDHRLVRMCGFILYSQSATGIRPHYGAIYKDEQLM